MRFSSLIVAAVLACSLSMSTTVDAAECDLTSLIAAQDCEPYYEYVVFNFSFIFFVLFLFFLLRFFCSCRSVCVCVWWFGGLVVCVGVT